MLSNETVSSSLSYLGLRWGVFPMFYLLSAIRCCSATSQVAMDCQNCEPKVTSYCLISWLSQIFVTVTENQLILCILLFSPHLVDILDCKSTKYLLLSTSYKVVYKPYGKIGNYLYRIFFLSILNTIFGFENKRQYFSLTLFAKLHLNVALVIYWYCLLRAFLTQVIHSIPSNVLPQFQFTWLTPMPKCYNIRSPVTVRGSLW